MKFNEALDSLQIYEAGKPIELVVREYGISPNDVIKLASNENPHGVVQAVKDRVAQALNDMYLYPDDSMYMLKQQLAFHYGVASKEMIIGSGSDQVIGLAIRAKCKKGDSVLMAGVTFAMYEIYSKAVGAKIIKTSSQTHCLDEFLSLYQQHKPSIVFLCTPNNPLGESLKVDEIKCFLQKVDADTLVIIDGAYQEYAAFKDEQRRIIPKEIIQTFPNTLYLGTFSKAYGLGGMRVGYGIASEAIIKALHKLRPPFNVTTLSLIAALEALKQQEFVESCVRDCFLQMERYESFCRQKGIVFIPSFANFITLMLDGVCNASKLANELLQRGVIVRDLAPYQLNALRITIGTQKQNDRLLRLLEEFVFIDHN